MNIEIKEIIKNLKLANKNNLDKIYLQIEANDKTEIINLESGEKTKNLVFMESNKVSIAINKIRIFYAMYFSIN